MGNEFNFGFDPNDYTDLTKMWINSFMELPRKTSKEVIKEAMKDKEFENITYSNEEKIELLKAKIDFALEDGNKDLFMELSQEYNELVKC